MLVQICSAYSGDNEKNIEQAKEYSRFILQQGNIPLAPHLLFPQFLDDNNPEERRRGIALCLAIMRYVDVVAFFGDLTEGMRMELEQAEKLRKKVRRYTKEMEVE